MTENDKFWLLPESQRNHIISAARTLMRKLDIPYDDAFDLVRQCGAIVYLTDQKVSKMKEAGIEPERVGASKIK